MRLSALVRIALVLISAAEISGCGPMMHEEEIVRQSERVVPVRFPDAATQATFDCTLGHLKKAGGTMPLHKLPQEDDARFLIFFFYQKEYFLSDAAFFNDGVDQADSDHDGMISRPEAIAFYKKNFPDRAHYDGPVPPEQDGLLLQMQRHAREPLCDIHDAPMPVVDAGTKQ